MVVRPFGGFSCTVLQQLLGEGTGGSTNKDSSGTTATKAPVVPGFVPDDFFQVRLYSTGNTAVVLQGWGGGRGVTTSCPVPGLMSSYPVLRSRDLPVGLVHLLCLESLESWHGSDSKTKLFNELLQSWRRPLSTLVSAWCLASGAHHI